MKTSVVALQDCIQEFGQQNFADAATAVNSIDLSMVKLKLMDPEEGKGWSLEQANHAEIRYRRYLCMVFVHRDGSIVPTQDVDAFWHQHILDTRAYAKDCERVFGEFIHHFPYFGMRGEADAQNLASSFEETCAIYASAFGEEYGRDDMKSSKCGNSRCGSGKCTKCGTGHCHHPINPPQ